MVSSISLVEAVCKARSAATQICEENTADRLVVDSNGYFHDQGCIRDNKLVEVGDVVMGVDNNAMRFLPCPPLDVGAVEMHLVAAPQKHQS